MDLSMVVENECTRQTANHSASLYTENDDMFYASVPKPLQSICSKYGLRLMLSDISVKLLTDNQENVLKFEDDKLLNCYPNDVPYKNDNGGDFVSALMTLDVGRDIELRTMFFDTIRVFLRGTSHLYYLYKRKGEQTTCPVYFYIVGDDGNPIFSHNKQGKKQGDIAFPEAIAVLDGTATPFYFRMSVNEVMSMTTIGPARSSNIYTKFCNTAPQAYNWKIRKQFDYWRDIYSCNGTELQLPLYFYGKHLDVYKQCSWSEKGKRDLSRLYSEEGKEIYYFFASFLRESEMDMEMTTYDVCV